MPHKILIVDDHPINIAILKKVLGNENYHLETAVSGEEALATMLVFHPDLVLLDIMMAGIDGYETCRRIRANPVLTDTKIIMVSARAMAKERQQGYEAGADYYIIKPFDKHDLLDKVHRCLAPTDVDTAD